jgi:hypothetical protein
MRCAYEERPAVRANGTVNPSANPMMISRVISLYILWCSLCIVVRTVLCLLGIGTGCGLNLSGRGSPASVDAISNEGGIRAMLLFSLWKFMTIFFICPFQNLRKSDVPSLLKMLN